MFCRVWLFNQQLRKQELEFCPACQMNEEDDEEEDRAIVTSMAMQNT